MVQNVLGREFTKKKKGKQKTKDTTVESQEKAAQNAAVATASDVQMLQDLLAAKKRALELETSSREDQQALEMPLENERAAQENVVGKCSRSSYHLLSFCQQRC